MRYKCQFPKCSYTTNDRTKIDYHHIVPRELKGQNDDWNRIWLCPNCHRKIYIPESNKGIHSKKSRESVVLLNIYNSTSGKVLEYVDEEGIVKLNALI